MNDDTSLLTIDQFDERLAETAAALLKTILQAARLRHAEDPEAVGKIDGLTACRLTITAVGPEVQLQLIGTVTGGTKRFYAATFTELGPLH